MWTREDVEDGMIMGVGLVLAAVFVVLMSRWGRAVTVVELSMFPAASVLTSVLQQHLQASIPALSDGSDEPPAAWGVANIGIAIVALGSLVQMFGLDHVAAGAIHGNHRLEGVTTPLVVAAAVTTYGVAAGRLIWRSLAQELPRHVPWGYTLQLYAPQVVAIVAGGTGIAGYLRG